MKANKHKLFIDTENDGIHDISTSDSTPVKNVFMETDKYSITPTTFKSRTLFGKFDTIKNKVIESFKIIEQKGQEFKIKQAKLKELELKFEKELKDIVKGEMSETEVFGHMQKTKPTSDIQIKYDLKLTEINNYSKELEQYLNYLKKYNDLVISYQDIYSNEYNAVLRYGIDIANITLEQTKDLVNISNPIAEKEQSIKSKSNKSGSKDDQSVLLHPLEIFLIRDVIDYLIRNQDKTVLVDIFARDLKNGNILLKDFKPEVHTIILYKNNEKEIVVIDPSNSDFSKHLAVNTTRIFDNESIKIVAHAKEIKIYEPADKNKVGPNSDQYRDCIDIAVKLAFGLNQLKNPIDIKNIDFLYAIQEVTNSGYINKHISSVPDDCSLRIKQASNSTTKENINKLLIYIDKQLKSFSAHPKQGAVQLSEKMQEQYIEKLYTVSSLENEQYQSGVDILGEFERYSDIEFAKFINN